MRFLGLLVRRRRPKPVPFALSGRKYAEHRHSNWSSRPRGWGSSQPNTRALNAARDRSRVYAAELFRSRRAPNAGAPALTEIEAGNPQHNHHGQMAAPELP